MEFAIFCSVVGLLLVFDVVCLFFSLCVFGGFVCLVCLDFLFVCFVLCVCSVDSLIFPLRETSPVKTHNSLPFFVQLTWPSIVYILYQHLNFIISW